MKKMLNIMGLFFIAAVLCAFSSCRASQSVSIESVTYICKPAGPCTVEEMITVEITVYLSGEVLRQEKDYVGEIVLSETRKVDQSRAIELFNTFNTTHFFDWPDDLSSDSQDGNFQYFIVVSERNRYKKGGLNPIDADFVACLEAFNQYIGLE